MFKVDTKTKGRILTQLLISFFFFLISLEKRKSVFPILERHLAHRVMKTLYVSMI